MHFSLTYVIFYFTLLLLLEKEGSIMKHFSDIQRMARIWGVAILSTVVLFATILLTSAAHAEAASPALVILSRYNCSLPALPVMGSGSASQAAAAGLPLSMPTDLSLQKNRAHALLPGSSPAARQAAGLPYKKLQSLYLPQQ